jgi:putative SOS response-associated peptidase YedK
MVKVGHAGIANSNAARLLDQRRSTKTRQPYAIGLKSGEPYAFAGLWESWQPPEGDALTTFTILTTTPNELMAPIHDRMPVIVAPKNYERWLDTGIKSTPSIDLLQPYPAEEMEAWMVSDQVGNVRNNAPELLAQQEPDQGTLFS